jgi:hypothetical protein
MKYYSQCFKIFIRNRLLLLFKGTVAYYVFFSFFFSCRLIRFLNFFIFFLIQSIRKKTPKNFINCWRKNVDIQSVRYITLRLSRKKNAKSSFWKLHIKMHLKSLPVKYNFSKIAVSNLSTKFEIKKTHRMLPTFSSRCIQLHLYTAIIVFWNSYRNRCVFVTV